MISTEAQAGQRADRSGEMTGCIFDAFTLPTLSHGGDTLERLDAQFLADNTNMRKLLTGIATTAATTAETPNTANR